MGGGISVSARHVKGVDHVNIAEELRKIRVIPVIKMETADDAEALADALVGGGLPAAEITFRNDQAAESIRRMLAKYPDMMVGAGTVLTKQNIDDAIAAGAKFAVSPGTNPEVVHYCRECGLPFVPGVATATETEQALSLGITAVKFFPAEAMGGLKTIKALSAPYTEVEFMPTGGVNMQNVRDYLAFDRIYAVGGTWIASTDRLKRKAFDEIRKAAKEAAEL